MGAIRPNHNFYDETKVHIPYSEIMKEKMQTAYESFRSPKKLIDKTKNKKQKTLSDLARIDMRSYNKWFKQ
jgi:hypothetical protein